GRAVQAARGHRDRVRLAGPHTRPPPRVPPARRRGEPARREPARRKPTVRRPRAHLQVRGLERGLIRRVGRRPDQQTRPGPAAAAPPAVPRVRGRRDTTRTTVVRHVAPLPERTRTHPRPYTHPNASSLVCM